MERTGEIILHVASELELASDDVGMRIHAAKGNLHSKAFSPTLVCTQVSCAMQKASGEDIVAAYSMEVHHHLISLFALRNCPATVNICRH